MASPIPLHHSFLRLPIAHRGYHDRSARRIENSRAAVQAAIDAGYGIEIDVQPSADRVPMVFHDYDLRRLTGVAGRLRAHDADALGRIRLTDSDEGIPTLSEILRIVNGQVPLLVEIKDQDGAMGTDVGPLEDAVAVLLMAYRGPVAVMSFNPNSVAAMARAAPGIARGITSSAFTPEGWPLLPAAVRDGLREIPDYDRTLSSFISHEAADLGRPRVEELRRRKAGILCWTIRSPEAEADARRIAQNITFEGYAAPIPA